MNFKKKNSRLWGGFSFFDKYARTAARSSLDSGAELVHSAKRKIAGCSLMLERHAGMRAIVPKTRAQ